MTHESSAYEACEVKSKSQLPGRLLLLSTDENRPRSESPENITATSPSRSSRVMLPLDPGSLDPPGETQGLRAWFSPSPSQNVAAETSCQPAAEPSAKPGKGAPCSAAENSRTVRAER